MKRSADIRCTARESALFGSNRSLDDRTLTVQGSYATNELEYPCFQNYSTNKLPSFTGYEPKQLAECKDHQIFTEDKQLAEYQDLAEHEDLRVKPLFSHRPSTASTCDSARDTASGLGLRR